MVALSTRPFECDFEQIVALDQMTINIIINDFIVTANRFSNGISNVLVVFVSSTYEYRGNIHMMLHLDLIRPFFHEAG